MNRHREHQPAFKIPSSCSPAQMCPGVFGDCLPVLLVLQESWGRISPSATCPEVVGDIQSRADCPNPLLKLWTGVLFACLNMINTGLHQCLLRIAI